jgi:CRISPR-associated protein Csb2
VSTVLALRFPAGRYHATPWWSHANEADIEWPPSPWRILRALIATWHRKIDPAEFSGIALERLIHALAGSDPAFRLPAATRAHSRHYMPVRAGAGDRPVLIFDGFARVNHGDELIVGWPDVDLESRERDLLVRLIEVAGYLGRAESWIEGRVLDAYDGGFNCGPVGSDRFDSDSGHGPTRLLAPVTPAAYEDWRSPLIAELGLDAKRRSKAQNRLLATLPDRLVDALRLDTGDLRDAGWNIPPGGRMVTYLRPGPETSPKRRHRQGREPKRFTTARLALAGRPLPRIEDAVRIGEAARAAAMRATERASVGAGVPSEISGHGLGDDPNHRHAFFLPEDADGDGVIDHLVIHAPGGLSRIAAAGLDHLQRLWTDENREWQVVVEGFWEDPRSSLSRYTGSSTVWVSETPYLKPWYSKRNFDVVEQVRRECRERDLPEPGTVRVLPSIRIRGRERRAVHFHRFRSKRGLRQPDSRGSLLELEFPEPVAGPLALGFACHYGLGMFRPAGG